MDDREINGSVTGVEGMILKQIVKIRHLRYEPDCPMIYMANGVANAELLRSVGCLSTHEEESRQAPTTCHRVGLEGYHTGGDTCACISSRNEDEFETEIKMIN